MHSGLTMRSLLTMRSGCRARAASNMLSWRHQWLNFPALPMQTVDYAPELDAPAAALLTDEELAVCTTSHKPRQLAAFKMQHLLAEAEPHIPHSLGRLCWPSCLRSPCPSEACCTAPVLFAVPPACHTCCAACCWTSRCA